MKKVLFVLLCLALVSCVGTAALADQDASPRTIQTSEAMLFQGKDLFSYTSGELYALLHTLGLYDPETIGYHGYYGEDDPEDELVPGLALDFGGFFAMTQSDDPDAPQQRAALTALPLEETAYRVYYVGILEPGIPGPFGIEVGMPVETLLGLLPEMKGHPGASGESEGTLTMRYQSDESGEPVTYELTIYCADEKVTSCYVQRSGGTEPLHMLSY